MKKSILSPGVAPLYVRLKEVLRDDIEHHMSPGDLIPSETALIEQYDVSRTTVRLALIALANEGLITRQQGKGSFVADRKRTVEGSAALLALEDEASSSATLVSVEWARPDVEVTSELEQPDGAEVCRIRWTEHEGSFTRCYRVSYLPADVAAGFDVEEVQSVEGIRRSLKDDMEAARETARYVTVVLADPFRASMLEVQEGVPLMRIETILHGANGKPLEVSRVFYGGHSVRVRLW